MVVLVFKRVFDCRALNFARRGRYNRIQLSYVYALQHSEHSVLYRRHTEFYLPIIFSARCGIGILGTHRESKTILSIEMRESTV